jgi:hypothetical protein
MSDDPLFEVRETQRKLLFRLGVTSILFLALIAVNFILDTKRQKASDLRFNSVNSRVDATAMVEGVNRRLDALDSLVRYYAWRDSASQKE